MNLRKDIEAEITFLPTHAGGRKEPVFSNYRYRPQFFYDGGDWDAAHTYPDVEHVNPGDTVRAYLVFTRPAQHVGKLYPGKMFLIREGQKVVAYGQVHKILDLEASAARDK